MVEVLPEGVLRSDKEQVLRKQQTVHALPDVEQFGAYIRAREPHVWTEAERATINDPKNVELQYREWWRCKGGPEKDGLAYMCYNWFWIVNLENQTTLFKWNYLQWLIHLTWAPRNVIVKSRRVGGTLYCQARYLHHCLFTPNIKALLVAHDTPSTHAIYERAELMVELLPAWLQPLMKSKTQATGMAFTSTPFLPELRSSYRIGTAGHETLGHGTDVDDLHLSEFASYSDAARTLEGVGQALRRNPQVSIESTGEAGTEFERLVRRTERGDTRYKLHFLPWYLRPDNQIQKEDPDYDRGKLLTFDPEITALQDSLHLNQGQVTWWQFQRNEIGARVYREYPTTLWDAFSTPEHAWFDSFKMRRIVNRCRGRLPLLKEGKDPYWHDLRLADAPGNVVGGVYVYERPKAGWRYRAGVDVAEGIPEIGDESTLVILDAYTRKQVLVAHGRWRIQDFASLIWDITGYYGGTDPWGCPVAVEMNNHGHAIVELLRQRIANHTRWHEQDEIIYLATFAPPGTTKARKLGFEMTKKMRAYLFDAGKKWIEDEEIEIVDEYSAEQFRQMIYDADKKRPDHPPGGFSDVVIATLGAAALSFELAYRWVPVEVTKAQYASPVHQMIMEEEAREFANIGKKGGRRQVRSKGNPLADMYADAMIPRHWS